MTGECGPPKSADGSVIEEKAKILKGYVDAVNITDNQTAVVRVCSMASGVQAQQNGLEAIMQMTCRDRNRLAMQADILGASVLGIKNILCLTGDHMSFGNHPEAKGVHDLDAINLIKMYKDMRDEAKFQCGDEMDGGPADLHRLRREPVRRSLRVPRPAPQEEGRGGRRLHADPMHLQHPQVQEVDGGGARHRPAQRGQDPGRHHPASRAPAWPST